MAKIGKRMKAALEKINTEKEYSLEEACSLLVEVSKVKFDETVDVAVNLGVDPRKADQNVRGSVALPHGLGKNIRVLVFAKGDKAQEAERAGADFIGAEDLVEKIKGGFQEFDSVVATPDLMVQVGKVGKILGPRGLMPSPKIGTVTFDVESTVRSIKAGRGEYRVEKTGIVHAPVGKVSFGGQKLAENVTAMMQALHKAKPSTSKGVYFKKATVSSTMGPGLKIDLAPFRGM